MEDGILEQPVLTEAPAASAEPTVESNEQLFQDLALDTDESPFLQPEPTATPAPAEPAVAPTVPGSTVTPPAAEPPATAPVPPAASAPASTAPLPQATTQPSTGEPAPAPPTTEQLWQQRTSLINDIASRYTFTPEQEAQLQTEPEKVLPQIAARLQVETFEAVFQTIMAQLPTVLSSFRQQETASARYNDAFYGRWPALRDARFNQRLTEVATAYRQSNPRATPEQAIEAIGAMVHVMEGIPVGTPAPAAPPAAVAAPPPLASSMRPPAPAGVGASSRPVGVPSTPNIFEELSLFEG